MACKECGEDGSCSCILTGGLNVEVTGAGTPDDPYVIEVARQYLEGATTASAITTVTGNGNPDNPYFISITSAETEADGLWTGSDADWLSIAGVDPATEYIVVKNG